MRKSNSYWTAPKPTKPTHKTPSKMGGVFYVEVVEDIGERCKVRVIAIGAEWHGFEFTPLKSALTPLAAS